MKQELVDYIRQNIATYNRQTIEEELSKQGFSQEEIQEAWEEASRIKKVPNNRRKGLKSSNITWEEASWGDSDSSHEERNREGNEGFWPTFLAFLLGGPLVIVLLNRFFFNFSFNDALNAFAVLNGLALVVTVILWDKWKNVAKGLLAGVLCSVLFYFIPVSIIIGICNLNTTR